ncbi:M23 family metallopeptidase [Streptomyces olivaceoviridis]
MTAVSLLTCGAGATFAAGLPAPPPAARQTPRFIHAIVDPVVQRTRTELLAQACAQSHADLTGQTPSLDDWTAQPVFATPSPRPAKKTPRRPAADKPAVDKPAVDKPAVAWRAPVDEHRITAGYRSSGTSWASGRHTGIDFPVPVGTPVGAAGDGTVVTAGRDKAYGNQIVIRHRDGTYTQYAHLSQLTVHLGQRLHVGQRIGLSGATGNVTGPHLHFEARTMPGYGHDVDPVAWLRAHGVIL